MVGFDDSPLATATEVKLTTLTHPKEELGTAALEWIIAMIEKRQVNRSDNKVFKPELIVRESTREL